MKAELVLIPCAARGHLPAAVEFAKLLVTRSHRLSITVLLIKFPFDPCLAAYADSLVASFASDRINFVDITMTADAVAAQQTNIFLFMEQFIESHRSRVRNAVVSPDGALRPGLAGFVLDMARMSMADVADELGVPTYVFWAASAGSLSLNFDLQMNTEKRERLDFETEHSFPGFTNPVPGRVLPSGLFNAAASVLLGAIKRIRESRSVIINTSEEIEPHALRALMEEGAHPPVYAVGPILHLPEDDGDAEVQAYSGSSDTAWLDDQPPSSVLLLCFGSMGSFSGDQVREIASAIESAGVRFLWALRQFSADHPDRILPEGFLERTAGTGRVVGWAPQAAVLGHRAVGGFVSHCGWNSVLESVWHGVPVAAWPLYAEQQLNAFKMVGEMRMAVEVKMDYRYGFGEDDGDGAALVRAEVIEAAMRKVMEGESEIRRRTKEMSGECRHAVVEGGSSFSSLARFLSHVLESSNFN